MKKLIISFVLLGVVFAGLVYFWYTNDEEKNGEVEISESSEGATGEVAKTTDELLAEMSNQELKNHLIEYQSDYNTYGDFIEENQKMIEFSLEQIMIPVTALSNNSSISFDEEIEERFNKGIVSVRAYITEARQLKNIPLLAGEIHSSYLSALAEFEQLISEVDNDKKLDLSSIISHYNFGNKLLKETERKMADLESLAYNLMDSNEIDSSEKLALETKSDSESIEGVEIEESLNDSDDFARPIEEVYAELFQAIEDNNLEKVNGLLNGIDINYDFNATRPLILAAWWGYIDIAELLINAGADRNLSKQFSRGFLSIRSSNRTVTRP